MELLPSHDSRTVVLGSTGSGKTFFGVWLLSNRDWNNRPWFIIDFKRDSLIAKIGAKEHELGKKLPTEPGLYVIRPLPGDEELVSKFAMDCYYQENVGIYTDEGTMLPPYSKHDRWWRALQTQGRSKNIELITCSQRPVWLDKQVFTEASFFAVLRLNNRQDRLHTREFMNGRSIRNLPRFWTEWYDVTNQETAFFKPVPRASEIVALFNKREVIKPQEREKVYI